MFDIRLTIGGLFTLNGVIVTVAGVFVSDAGMEKAEGVNINLWTGLAMPALGLFFPGWTKPRPVRIPPHGLPRCVCCVCCVLKRRTGPRARSRRPAPAPGPAAPSARPAPPPPAGSRPQLHQDPLHMRTGGARRDAHAGGDQPGVLTLGDPHQHLDLARREHPQQPLSLVVRLRRRIQQLGEGPCNSPGATAASPARAFTMARSTPSMRSSCRT